MLSAQFWGLLVALLLRTRVQLADLCLSVGPSTHHMAVLEPSDFGWKVWRADISQPYWAGAENEMYDCSPRDLNGVRIA